MKCIGMKVDKYYYEVVIVQYELGLIFLLLIDQGDNLQKYKYIIYNVVVVYGKLVIFMLKLMEGDNGLGMYVNMLIWKDGKLLFVGDKYVDLLDEVLYFIGGILKYVKVLNVFINLLINLYKCLILGFEVLVLCVYLVCNCLGCVCIFWIELLKVKCVEVCFLDLLVNLYLCFVVLLMVGLDGIKNKIDLGVVLDKDLYDLLLEELVEILIVCVLLCEVLDVLEVDYEFLLVGDVFIKDQLDGYMELKWEEVYKYEYILYLVEYQLYYSV